MHAGQAVIGSDIARRLAGLVGGSAPEDPFPDLTDREREILDLLAGGATTTQIADRLGLSPKTVRNHLSSIFTKIEALDRTQAVLKARAAGLPASLGSVPEEAADLVGGWERLERPAAQRRPRAHLYRVPGRVDERGPAAEPGREAAAERVAGVVVSTASTRGAGNVSRLIAVDDERSQLPHRDDNGKAVRERAGAGGDVLGRRGSSPPASAPSRHARDKHVDVPQ